MKLVMAMKVRDEGDVLEDNLRFHHALGVEHFIVTDNRSSDRTVEILDRYAQAGIATVTREESTNYKDEAIGWMQRMARQASEEHGADWVFHGDADEFWWPVEGTLGDALATVPPSFGAVSAPRTEFVARPDAGGSFAERMDVREARSSLRPKLVHRGDPEVVLIDRGAHYVTSRAELEYGRGPRARPRDLQERARPCLPVRSARRPLRHGAGLAAPDPALTDSLRGAGEPTRRHVPPRRRVRRAGPGPQAASRAPRSGRERDDLRRPRME